MHDELRCVTCGKALHTKPNLYQRRDGPVDVVCLRDHDATLPLALCGFNLSQNSADVRVGCTRYVAVLYLLDLDSALLHDRRRGALRLCVPLGNGVVFVAVPRE